jgi:pyruvate/2-oxoglutarate dehydrogenase complex dihydrolipoamide acyltransferase (E2) component
VKYATKYLLFTDHTLLRLICNQGTIVEWTVEVGQAVQDGDVVALVETDKVTVEIKANMNGVITQRFGAV